MDELKNDMLEVAATELLQAHGYTYDGRPKEEENWQQAAFESRWICCPSEASG